MAASSASRNKLAVGATSYRPTVIGRKYAIACGHYLGAQAAMRVLDRGGNVVDAGVTAAIALAVLQPDIVGFAGVAPTLVHRARENAVWSLAGLGGWPAATDVGRLAAEGNGAIPEGLLRTVVPAAPATHVEALARFGTISFEEAATPAMEIAREGFAVFPLLAHTIAKNESGYRRWGQNAAIFLPQGRPPRVGEILRQRDLATVFGRLIEAERRAPGGREAKLRAVHDCFYRGAIGRDIDAFHRAHDGFLRLADLAEFTVPVEPSLSVRYRDAQVHVCDVWCQGVTLLESLKILETLDPAALGRNSPDYAHCVIEAMNLAFADREAYVGDPRCVRVPTAGLLAEGYARTQGLRIDRARAFGAMPAPGRPEGAPVEPSRLSRVAPAETAPLAPDTIYCCVMDAEGNTYSATLSDNSYDAPVVPGTGLVISSRGSQSWLEAGHPSEVKPGKRPRLTPSPAFVLRDGHAYMGLGTPGGDVQSQAMLQVFLNVHAFGLSVQQAVEAPRFCSANFPNSFSPHDYVPGRLNLEETLPGAVIDALRSRGHDVEVWPAFPAAGGAVCAVMRDPSTGWLHAGADPRREAYAAAW